MARSFSRLFFSAAKKIARLQQTAIRLATPKAKRKRVAKSAKTPSGAVPSSRPSGKSSSRSPVQSALGAGTWETQQHFSDYRGQRLSFARYTPLRTSPHTIDEDLPLVVMLHGCRQTAEAFALGTRMNVVADGGGFMVLYPQQAVTRNAHRCWRWFAPDVEHGLADADAIAALIRSEVARYGLDPERIYIAGMSAGASMAAMVALRNPGLISAAALHSGVVLGDAHSAVSGLTTLRRGTLKDPVKLLSHVVDSTAFRIFMPVIILQGLRDNAVSPQNATQLAAQFREVNGLMDTDVLREREFAVGTKNAYRRTDISRGTKTLLRLCAIEQLDHAWSGGDDSVKFHSRNGPDASALIWRFLKMHRRSRAAALLAEQSDKSA